MDPLQELLMAVDDAQDSAEKLDNRRSQRLTARKRLAGMIESELRSPKLSKGRKETEPFYGPSRSRVDMIGARMNDMWSNGATRQGLERVGSVESSKMSSQNDLAGRGFPATSSLVPSIPELLRSLSDSTMVTQNAFPSLSTSLGPFAAIGPIRGLPEASLINTTPAPSLQNLFLYSGDPLSAFRSVPLPPTSAHTAYPFFAPSHTATLPSLFGINALANSSSAPLATGKFSEHNPSAFTPSQAERILSLMPSLSSTRGPLVHMPLPESVDTKAAHGSRFLPTFSPTLPLPRDAHEDSHSQTSSSAPGTPRSGDEDSSTTALDSLSTTPSVRLSPSINASSLAALHAHGLPINFGLPSHYPAPSEALGALLNAKMTGHVHGAPSSPNASASSSVAASSPFENHSSPALQPGCGRYAEYIHDLKTVCAQCAASGRLKSKKKPLVDSLILLAYFGDGIKRDPHGLEYIIEDSNVARELMNIISSNIRPPSRGTNNSYDNWKRAMGKSFRKCGHSFTPKDEDTAKYARHVEEHIARIHQRTARRQVISGE